MKKYLERDHYEVVEKHSGLEALDEITTFKPHLVFMDIMMPNINGWDVCRKIKYGSQGAKTFIFMVTSLDNEDSIKRSIQYSMADGYFKKPLKFDELSDFIKDIFDSGVKPFSPKERD